MVIEKNATGKKCISTGCPKHAWAKDKEKTHLAVMVYYDLCKIDHAQKISKSEESPPHVLLRLPKNRFAETLKEINVTSPTQSNGGALNCTTWIDNKSKNNWEQNDLIKTALLVFVFFLYIMFEIILYLILLQIYIVNLPF